MMKKVILILAAFLLAFSFSWPALAEEAGDVPPEADGAAYDDYDDGWVNGYEEPEGSPGASRPQQRPWTRYLSVAPVLFGAAVGAAAVVFLSRRSRPEAPRAVPCELRPKISVDAQRDRLLDVTRTTRDLRDHSNEL